MGLPYFNSIKVQLEHNMQNADNHKYQFQFHKGTIRTHVKVCNLVQYRDFNSIKVQLELMIQSFVKCFNPYFNSIKVQLEQNIASTMAKYSQFQFHKGTIRTKFPKLPNENALISIP